MVSLKEKLKATEYIRTNTKKKEKHVDKVRITKKKSPFKRIRKEVHLSLSASRSVLCCVEEETVSLLHG